MKRIARQALFIGAGVIVAAVITYVSARFIVWPEIGKCLLGLVLFYAAAHGAFILFRKLPNEQFGSEFARLLLALLASALMTRMALNGRIYQYGFYQAAIAGCIIPAILISEMGQWMRAGRRERIAIGAIVAALFLPGIFIITRSSHALLAAKTSVVGEGRDRFYCFARRYDPTGEIVAAVSRALQTTNTVRSLVVMPEGVMINYLARIPSPLPIHFFWVTNEGLGWWLDTRAPEGILLISRDLREYGIERFGANPGQGKELLDVIARNYRQVAHVGGDPLDVRQRGAILYQRKETP